MGKDGKSKSLLVSAVFCFAETAALNSLNVFWFCVPWPPRVVNQHLTLASVDIAWFRVNAWSFDFTFSLDFSSHIMALFENGELANNSYLNNHGRGIFLFFCFAFCFFPGSWWLLWLLWLLRSWLLVAPGGSWWLLLVAPLAPGGYCGFRSSWWLLVASVASMASMALGSYSSSLLWLIYHLSESINQSISETCSPGACCALDTPWVSSIHPSIHPPTQPAIHPSISIFLYFYLYIYTSRSLSLSLSLYLSI